MNDTISIIADYREKPSGIPDLLMQKNAKVTIQPLMTGDYLINERVIIERKSAEDFIQSIINNRLFEQCSRMRRTVMIPAFLLEGDPYSTNHRMNDQAIRGALLSVKVAWQIPVIFSNNKEESADLLMMIGRQVIKDSPFIPLINGYKPKKARSRKLRFLQGLPAVGPRLANRLYGHFGTIQSVISAPSGKLMEIDGIGKNVARGIREFIMEKH